jgi:serine/threonine-protein kinase HipA
MAGWSAQRPACEAGWVSDLLTTATSYLASPVSYDLDPVLPKSAGVFQSPPGKPLFSAFADSAPDRWGQNLMRREERERAATASSTPRSLRSGDFLLGVRDDTR